MINYQNKKFKIIRFKTLAICLFFSLIFSCNITFPAVAKADNPIRKIWSGWLPYYGIAKGVPSTLNNLDLTSEISPFWYTYTNNQNIKDLYSSANPNLPVASTIAQLKSNGLKLLPTLTDGMSKNAMANLIANPSLQSNLINQISNLVSANQFDGIELDFENFAFVDSLDSWTTTQPNWINFIKNLSTSLHAANKLLAIDSPVQFDPTSGKKGYWVYSWKDIAPYIDRLRIMGYDYSVSKPGPIGPINWEENSLKYAVTVIPASKIYLGIPGYGRNWITQISGVCPSDVATTVSTKAPASTFVQNGAQVLASNLNANIVYDSATAEATFTYQKTYNGFTGNQSPTSCTVTGTAWFQNDQSFLARANLVSKYHLGGLAEWTLGFENSDTMNQIRSFAASIAPDQVLALLTSNQDQVPWGVPINLQAHFNLKDTTAVTGASTHLQRKDSLGNWQDISTGTSDNLGNISFDLISANSGSIRIITDSTWDKAASVSKTFNFQVLPKINLSAPLSVPYQEQFSITGNAIPANVNEQMQLYLNSRLIDKYNLTTSGLFSLMARAERKGINIYQVKVVDLNPNKKNQEISSAELVVLVR